MAPSNDRCHCNICHWRKYSNRFLWTLKESHIHQTFLISTGNDNCIVDDFTSHENVITLDFDKINANRYTSQWHWLEDCSPIVVIPFSIIGVADYHKCHKIARIPVETERWWRVPGDVTATVKLLQVTLFLKYQSSSLSSFMTPWLGVPSVADKISSSEFS